MKLDNFLTISCQHDHAQAVIHDCLQQLEAVTTEYNFAFIYATDAMSAEFPELIEKCKKTSGIQHWLGTLGIGIIAPAQELYDRPAVSIMLASFDENEFAMLPLIKNPAELASVTWPHTFMTHFGILHGDPSYQHTQDLIEDIPQQLDECFLVGGLTSSRDKQYQVADQVFSGGVSGAFFSENIPVLSNLSQGCSPVGDRQTITKASDNVIIGLDHKPALDVLMDTMNISDFSALKKRANEVFTGLCIPHSDKSDYTVRNLLGVDPQNRVFAINDLAVEGNEIVFCERNEQSAIKDLKRMLDSIARRLKHKPRGGLYFSCLGRGREQFGQNSEEIKLIHNTLGDFPLTGFFANGEVHHNKLYGYTGVLTLFT